MAPDVAEQYSHNDRSGLPVEQGSKNHELVPTALISQIAGLRGGSGVHRSISALAKAGLIAKVKNAKYDGYRLTYGGLDYLALNTHRKGNTIFSLGNQIGVGKESDIYITASPEGRQLVLKLHRLGRISFRTVKANRDYLRNRAAGSWMYLSRLAAQKEHAFMRVLHREGFPVPEPIAWSRHTVVMEFVDAFPLRMIDSVANPGKLYGELMEMIVQLAQRGLIHGDFNEFNLLIKEVVKGHNVTLIPILIDFPQTISTNHANAEMYFDRDVACVKRYFEKKLKYTSDEPGPFFADAIKDADHAKRLDVEVEASGFSRKMFRELDRYVETVGGDSEADATAASMPGTENSEQADDEDDETDSEVIDEDTQEDELVSPVNQQPDFEEQLSTLNLTDNGALKKASLTNYGLVPLDIAHEDDLSAEKLKSKKKASGWAI
nr:serine/threonine-protein kinase rio2 [Quercus suber]